MSLVSVVNAQEYVADELIIKYKESGSQSSGSFSKMAKSKGLSVKRHWKGLKLQHFSMKPGSDMNATIEELSQDPNVEYVERNYYFNKASLDTPQDVKSFSEFQATATNGTFAQTSANIEVSQAWNNMSSGDSPVVVAVIDTGLDLNHDAFKDTCAIYTNMAEYNGTAGIDDDGNGYVDDVHGWNFVLNNPLPMDDDGHGTHVSGIVVGTGRDLTNLPSSGNECMGAFKSQIQIMPLKFLDGSGSGTTSDAIEAIYYAVNNGATVLNNSWGGGNYSQALHEAIVYTYSKNAIFVAAAGNAGSDNDEFPMFPASYDVPNVLSIAATTSSDYKASFSNFGSGSVHMGSPGVAIYSTIPNGYYGSMSGTSMAAPFISGMAALMLREKPNMNGYQMKSIIIGQGDAVSSLALKTIYGTRLNVNQSLVYAKNSNVDPYQPSYDISSSSIARKLASEDSVQTASCGLVKSIYDKFDKPKAGPKGGSPLSRWLLLIALALPMGVYVYMRRLDPASRRSFERFKIDSQVSLSVDGKELQGNIGTISLGGVGVNVDHLIEHGSVVKMKIMAPDGSGEIEVDGHIVWTDGGQQHGIQFDSLKDKVKQAIEQWTEQLTKA